MDLEKVKKFVRKFGYDDAEYRGEWKEYQVYAPILDDDEPANVGKPEFVLVHDDTIRMATEDEAFEYIDSLPDDEDVEMEKNVGAVAKTFDEILKFNPYHDSRGRFASANSYSQFTIRTRDPKKQHMADAAVAREKERHKKQQEEQEKPRTITLNQRYKEMANNWTFMKDKGAFVEKEANKQLDAFREEFKSDDYTPEQKAYLKQRENEYADLLTDKYNDQLYREGTNPSAMIAGPAKFDHRRYERKYEAEMRSQEEYREKQKKFVENTRKQLDRMEPEEKQIDRWRQGKWKRGETIDSDDPLAEKKLQAKLDYHTEQQQKMKDANAYYRKNGSMQGFTGFNDATNKRIDAEMQAYKDRGMDYYAKQPFQSYTLTNNNASIKATRDRLTQFQNRKQTASKPGGSGGNTRFDGGQLVRNTDINRLQIKFDSIPDAAMRQKLKSSGWRWSPREGAWQRQLTDNAERSAQSILGITKSMGVDVEKGDGDMSRHDYIEIVEVTKFNPYHDARGRFASANGSGRAYGTTGTGDALQEVRSGKANSLAAHMDENGKLTPEREAVHKKIIDQLLAGKTPVEGQATMTMLGGGPASGKSSVMNPDTSNDPHAVTVDPDAIKKMLPGFNEMAKKDPNAAAYYHEESSALAKRFSEVAFGENYNVIYDGTGDGSNGSVQKKIDSARAHGYRVEAKYVSVDTESAVQRNQKRYDDAVARGETPRLPPVDMVRATHAKCTDISVAMANKFDHIEIWDNNGSRGQQKMIMTGGSGKGLTVVNGQDAAAKRYLDKGLGSYSISSDGQIAPGDN